MFDECFLDDVHGPSHTDKLREFISYRCVKVFGHQEDLSYIAYKENAIHITVDYRFNELFCHQQKAR